MKIKYILSDLFKRENKDCCEQLKSNKDLAYAIVKGNKVAFVVIPPIIAIELGLLRDDEIPQEAIAYGWGSKTVRVKKIKTQGLGYGQ